MNSWHGEYFDPSDPEILAAYADGEFEGCPQLEKYRGDVENYLAQHPQVRKELAGWRRLKHLWRASTPQLPEEDCWQRVWHDIHDGLRKSGRERGIRIPWSWVAAGLAAAILVGVVAGWNMWVPSADEALVQPKVQQMAEKPEIKVLEVAADEDIEIIRVEFDGSQIKKTPLVAAGQLPVNGPMVLARFEDIQLAQPSDSSINIVADSDTPMILAGDGLPNRDR